MTDGIRHIGLRKKCLRSAPGSCGERGETESGIKAEITIRKKIPVAAGLAGGSSDAAGVMLGLNSLLELGLKLDKLREAGTQIGADVPFCIMAAAGQQPFLGVKGGAACALAEGIGEILTPLRSIVFWTVLAKPPAAVSTAEVYRLYDTITVRRHPDTSNLMEGMTSGNMQKIKASMAHVLENVTFRLCPQSEELKRRMEQKGCPGGHDERQRPDGICSVCKPSEGGSARRIPARPGRCGLSRNFDENPLVRILYTQYNSFIIDKE